MKDTVKIYTAFTSNQLFNSSQTYPLHHPDQKVLSNEEILDELRARTDGVEFLGSTAIEKPEFTVGNIHGRRQNIDGVLYFGSVPDELLELNIPIVAVYPLWSQWQQPFNGYTNHRVLTATLPVIPDISEEKFNLRLDGIAQKIGLLKAVAQMGDLRILCVTDKPVLGRYEPTGYQTAEEGWETYQTNYLHNLDALGSEIIARPQDEMLVEMEAVSDADADQMTQDWIAEAEEVKGTTEEEIKKSAKLYLALKEMMEHYDANAVTTEGYGVFMNYPNGPIPSQGLPSSQFCTDGIVATSETLVDSLITQQLGLFVTGSTGFNGDYLVDPENGAVYIGHCECPFNPYGDDQNVPFVIRNLPQWPENQQEKGGACVEVKLPAGEPVTVAKISVHDKKMAVLDGESLAGDELFPGWSDILCRTKLAVGTDAAAALKNLDWETFGNHRVVFYGDYRQQFIDLSTLLDFDIEEKDC
ncbi:MAG: hypothetical protein KGZ25_00300 [Planctomycetes bacterium]|nr:hypothetical protein [Planctomycetota bacterium]